MGEQFDASRPIYAQLVERLKARILAGTYPPGGHLDSVRDLAAAAGVEPKHDAAGPLPSWRRKGWCAPNAPQAAMLRRILH